MYGKNSCRVCFAGWPVGRRPKGTTPEGVFDLAGNVAEWIASLFRPYPYDAGDGRENAAAPGERVTAITWSTSLRKSSPR